MNSLAGTPRPDLRWTCTSGRQPGGTSTPACTTYSTLHPQGNLLTISNTLHFPSAQVRSEALLRRRNHPPWPGPGRLQPLPQRGAWLQRLEDQRGSGRGAGQEAGWRAGQGGAAGGGGGHGLPVGTAAARGPRLEDKSNVVGAMIRPC